MEKAYMKKANTPLEGFIAWCLRRPKRECRRGRRYFWPCRTRVGFGTATGPTLKTALCHNRALVGCIDKYQRSTQTLSGTTRHHSARLESYVIVVAPTSPPLLVADSTFFLRSFLRAMRGLLLQVGAFLEVINDQSK